MFKRKLFRRALPMILSVAMIFQSMPATALAAESSVQETAADSGTSDENIAHVDNDVSQDSASGGNDSQDSSSDGNISEDSDSEEETPAKDSSEEKSPEETSLEENTSNESKSEESSSEEMTSEENRSEEERFEENTSEENTFEKESSEETTAPKEIRTEIQPDSAEEMEGADQREDTAKEAAVVIDEESLRTALEQSELCYDEEAKTVFTVYDAGSKNPFEEIFKGYYHNEDEEDIYFFMVELEGKSNFDLTKQLRYIWKDATGKELAGVPKNAGSYQLEIALAEIPNVCTKASETLNFRINPRGVMVNYDEVGSIKPGITVKEAVEIIATGYQLELTDIEGAPNGNTLSKEAYAASCAVNIIRERSADGKKDGSTLKLEEIIKSNEEYSVQLEITLKDKDNYTLSNTSRKLKVATGVDTEIKANAIQADGTNFGWLYGEKPEMETLLKAVNPYAVEKPEDDADVEEEKKIANAKLQYQWLDADKKELEEAVGDGTKIPENVKDAGTYYLRISYAGESGQYNASKPIDVTITVSAVDVYIGDIQTDTDKYMEGAKVSNALQTITSYKVYKTGDEAKKDIMQGDKYFWGVSYHGDADQNTQSYEPVFKIRRGQHVTDKDGKDSVKWDDNYLDDTDSLIKTEKEDSKETTYEYRIEFSGEKAVYGEGNIPVGINTSQVNYRVDTTAETLAGNAFALTVEPAARPVVDVSKISEGKEGLKAKQEKDKGSLTNPLTKVYDNKPLYNTKGEYKLATVNGKSDVLSTDLTYQWQRITGYSESTKEDGSKDIIVDKDKVYSLIYHDVEYASAPFEAGNYRLAIGYTDSKTGAVSKTEYVYYTIEKEDILIEPKSNVTAYYGESVSSYLADIRKALQERAQNEETALEEKEPLIDYRISDFTEGEEKRELANAQWLQKELKIWDKDGESALTWTVERKITEGDKANSWYQLSNSDVFVEGGEYRLTVYADWETKTNSFRNYNNRYVLDFKNDKIKNEQTGAYEIQTRYADKQSVVITPAQTEGIQVEFEVDWNQIVQTTKVYDGNSFDKDMLEAVKNAVKAYNTRTGEAIGQADITFGWEWRRHDNYLSENYKIEGNVGYEEAIHAGNYYLVLSVPKGEKYLGQTVVFNEDQNVNNKKFVIMPSELTVKPELKDNIKAGTEILDPREYDESYDYNSEKNAKNVKNLIKNITISGVVAEADKIYLDKARYYNESEISYPYCIGYKGMRLDITDKATGQIKTGYLRGDRAYNVKFAHDRILEDYKENNEIQFYGTDYTLKFETNYFTAERANASVWGYGTDNTQYVRILDSVEELIHTITPREGIPYLYTDQYNIENKTLGGNYFAVQITAPREYTDVEGAEDKVIYRSSIENAGGYIWDEGASDDGSGYSTHCKYIIAVFDGSKIAAKEEGISFEIAWEEGFTETFQIQVPKSLLMEDLQKAVLPKSLAFNGASAKMAVGEGQQLDLKITKTQMADTICIAYESDSENVIVSDSGYVTAVHTGKATITAYAAYQDKEDGKIKPFLDKNGNKSKAAKLNITVSKVSEVKQIKLEAHDTYAYIDYANVSDGYRREVYVLEGANIPAVDFENKINAVKNGNYNAFDAHLFITDTERQEKNNAGKKFWGKIEGLKPYTQYTVYVRNVSALRSFLNGAQIDASEFATAGKPVKLVTTKSQQQALNSYFKTVEGNQPVYGKTTVAADERSFVKYNEKYEYYSVDISAKSIQLNVEAKYWQKDQAGIDYADGKDYIWYPLALTKAQQGDYINPKLTYYVTDRVYDSEPDDWKERGYVKADGYYFLPTISAAAIDKKGKLSLKGSGTVYVLAYDAEQDIVSNRIELYIGAAVDSVAGKPIKIKVGNTVSLKDYLTYKQGNIKLANYIACNLEIVSIEDTDNAFEITPIVYEGSEKIRDYKITAKCPTTKPLDLKIQDKTVKANSEGRAGEITIKLSAAALDPVKSLKAYDVYDTKGSIRFDYAGGMDNELCFRIEVKDQTGKILKNQLVWASGVWKTFHYRNADFYRALYCHDYSDNTMYDYDGFREYNAKKNIYTYYFDLENLDELTLTRQSSYTVSVTAVYDGYDARTISKKIKTTNIPASKKNIVVYDNQGKDSKNDGNREYGDILYYKDSKSDEEWLSDYPILKSGNTYTLDFTDADSNARKMKTDTLTWKSSNTKVATVKANAGTFTATLKAVKKGTTQITVTSKITKKIVARWTVFVNAVGEADGYFGDNIFQDISDAELADKLGADLLTLNNAMKFTLANGEKKWVALKAPSDGVYSVTTTGGRFIPYGSDSRPLDSLGNSWNRKEMQKGEVVYFLVTAFNNKLTKTSVAIWAEGTQYIPLSIGADGVKVHGGNTVIFTAPETNVYTFTAVDKNEEAVNVLSGNTMRIEKGKKQILSVNGSTSEDYTIKVTPAELVKDGTKIDLKKSETKYYQFTADASNEYTVYTADATEKIASGVLYNNILEWEENAEPKASSDTDTDRKNIGFKTRKLAKQDIIYIALTAGDKDITAAFKVEKASKVGEAFTIAKAGGTRTVVYTVEKDGEYRFAADGTNATITSIELVKKDDSSESFSNSTASWQKVLSKDDYVKFIVSAKDANTAVTVTCTPVEPITVKAGEAAKPVKVTSGLSQKVEFTALEDGWYAFTFDNNKVNVNDNTDASRAAYASGKEFYAKAGSTRIVTVSTSETTEQTANVAVTKAVVEKLTSMTEPKTLTKGKIYRYYWTADNEGLYDFNFTVAGAEITFSKIEGEEGKDSKLEQLSGYYSKGDTFYLTIKTGGADGSFKTVIAKQDAQELESNKENSITVAANASKWVFFTSKWSTKVRYQYSKADADGFAFYESTGLDNASTDKVFFTGSKVLRPGQKVYYKIENNNTVEKTVKLAIAPVLAKEIHTAAGTGAVSATATIKAGADEWYHFRAANAGRYSISVTSKTGNVASGFNPYDVYRDLTAEDYNSNEKSCLMEAEKDLYIRVANDLAANTEVTVTITDMAAAAISLELDASGKAEKTLTFKKDVTQYLRFNAKETARYTLTAVDKDKNTCSLPAKYYINRGDEAVSQIPINAIRLDAGSTMIVAVTVSEEIEMTVALAKENIIELTDKAEPQTISAGQTLYFRAKIGDRYSRYFIETSEAAEGLALVYQSVSDWVKWQSGYADFVPAPSQEELVFGLTATSTFEGTKTFKIRKGIVTPAPIKAGSAAESGELAAYHKVWYSFTPEKAGRYSIKTNGARVYQYSSRIIGSSSSVLVPSDFIVTDEMANKEIIYAVYHTDTAASKKVSLNIAEVKPAELDLNKPYIADIRKLESGEKIWLHFKAENDGRYTFKTSNSSAVSAMQWYKAFEENNYGTKYFNTEYGIHAGEEYYIAIPYRTKSEKNFDISVSAVTDSSAEAVSVSDTAKPLEMKKGEVKWLKFTPDKTANYKFEWTNLESSEIEAYDNLAEAYTGMLQNGNSYAVSARKTVYLKLVASYNLAEDQKPSIKITAEEMQTLAEGANTINISGATQAQYAFFTPSESAVYRFKLTDDANCNVGISIDGTSYTTLNLGDNVVYVLDKEHPAYIKVSASSSNSNAPVELLIEKAASVGGINAEDSKEVTFTHDSNLAFYKFTAPEDGVYVFEAADNKNDVYLYVCDSIDSNLLNPNHTYGHYCGFVAVELNKGAVKYIRISEYKEDLNSAEDTFTLTCKKAKETDFSGAGSINLNLKSGEPTLVRWTAGTRGNYELGYDVTEGDSVKYMYYSSLWIDNFPIDNDISSEGAWSQYEAYSSDGRYLILKANKVAQVNVFARIVPRSISIGDTQTVNFGSDKRYETFNFNMEAGKSYIFQTSESNNSALNSSIIDLEENDWYSSAITYYIEGNCYWIYNTPNKTKNYQFRVERPYGSNSDESFSVSVYDYQNCGWYDGIDSTGLDTGRHSVQYKGENWYQFTVDESNWYGFGTDYDVTMNLYKQNGSRLELLGTKECYRNNKIWSALETQDVVLAQTYYYDDHMSGDTYVQVTCNLDQVTDSEWNISDNNSIKNISVNSGYEKMIPLNFSELSEAATYEFTLTSNYDSENAYMTLYQTEGDIKTPLTGGGYNFIYTIDPTCSYELRVSNYSGSYWYGSINAQKQYPYEEYEVALGVDGYAQEVTVKDGSEARFLFTVPEDGNYMFYGTIPNNSSCDNYAQLWVNGVYVDYDDDDGGNGQFLIDHTLYVDDAVELRTYRYGHNSDEGTYTVHIEKVPEGYHNFTQISIGGTSSVASVYDLTANETRKYRFIAPTSNNSRKMSYMFYSQINNPQEDTNLTIDVEPASESIAYILGNTQKDENGNFFNVVELVPGRPYVFSITNTGSEAIRNTIYVYAYQYLSVEGEQIGGSNLNEGVELEIANGAESWVSYTVKEDGIYTFAVSNPSSYGYMNLYKVENSQLIPLLQDNNSSNKYFSSGSKGEIANIILNQNDQIVFRIYQGSHNALTCKIQVSWEIWEITSVDGDSNTKTVTTSTSNEEGKVWLTIREEIAEGKYTICTTTSNTTLKLYKNGEPMPSTPNNDTESEGAKTENSQTVTFDYKPDESAVYQLGITTTQSNVSLTITKEMEPENPDTGEDNTENDGNGDAETDSSSN